MHASSSTHKALAVIVKQDAYNSKCADCGKSKPTWASTNLGCFMCLECSGIHRAIGVHITKIKSITLDTWHKSEVEFMRSMGNFVHNARWAAFLEPGQGINSGSSMAERDQFIRAKYEAKKFFSNIPKEKLPSQPQGTTGAVSSGKLLTAAQRAKARKEAMAMEEAARLRQEKIAAETARLEAIQTAKQKKEDDLREAQREKELQARLEARAKERAAAASRAKDKDSQAIARALRKSQRSRRRSKGSEAERPQYASDNLFEGLSGPSEPISQTDSNLFDGLNTPAVHKSNAVLFTASVNDDTGVTDNMFDGLVSRSVSNSQPSGQPVASGFSFLAAEPYPGTISTPTAPAEDMTSGFSFLSTSAETVHPSSASPAANAPNQTVESDPFAELGPPGPTEAPIESGAAVVADACTENMSMTDVNIADLETNLAGVQERVQWFAQALEAFNSAKSTLVQIDRDLSSVPIVNDGASKERVQYLKEQVCATHSFIEALPSTYR